jgi:very-short-patch-repair endonuclease
MYDRLAQIADDQHGVFSLEDARRAGVTDSALKWRVHSGRYERIGPTSYRVVGASPTWRQAVMRAVSAAGDGAAAARRTALILHRVSRPDGTIEIVTRRRRRLRLDPSVVVHTAVSLPTEDIASVTGIPTTTVLRSLLDYAGVSHPDALAAAVDRAIASELTTAAELAAFLDRRRRRGRPGVTALEAVLERPALGIPESPYERGLLAMLHDAGLDPVPQFVIRDEEGRAIARVDAAFPDQRVAIEVDGHEYHSTRPQRAADADRQNRIEVLGWVVLRFTSDHVFRQDRSIVIRTRQALQRTGVT